MTREEAIGYFEKILAGARQGLERHPEVGKRVYGMRKELAEIALSALRPVSREKVERVWSGCPECKQRCGLCVHMGAWDRHGKPYVCEQCVDYSNFESDQRFCEVCGRPLTDEAVQMVMRRLEELKDGNSTD